MRIYLIAAIVASITVYVAFRLHSSQISFGRPVHMEIYSVRSQTHNYAEALQKSLYFYDCQRSGVLPPNFRVRWKGNAALTDGQEEQVDLSGGFFDAGDHMKFLLPMAASMTLLSWGGIDYRSGYEGTKQDAALYEIVRWGLDWIQRTQLSPSRYVIQVGDPKLDHAYWGSPENMTMSRPLLIATEERPASEPIAEAAAALAAGSILFRPADGTYANQLLESAKEFFWFAYQNQQSYGETFPEVKAYYNSWNGYFDELGWASIWLYRATKDSRYLTIAEDTYMTRVRGTLFGWGQNWDDKRYGLCILLGQLTGKSIYQEEVQLFFEYWIPSQKGQTQIQYTQGGLAWLTEWGSLRYAATMAFLAGVVYDRFPSIPDREKYRNFKISQVSYILGSNPLKFSYLVGFGDKFPKNPHHRGSHGSLGNILYPTQNQHTLYGALVGGPTKPDDFAYVDSRTDYKSNEVALDYNAGLTGALAQMWLAFGGEPIAGF